jgi:sn-glycerol 3-phosphate transport system substrate-binding protein
MRRSVAILLLLTACSSGESILVAGNEEVTTTAPAPTSPPATAAPGETLPPTTTQPPATTTTTPLASLPPCPVDALDGATAPVDVTFWHGLGGESEDALVALVDAYHGSQDRVRIHLENQGGYKQTIDKYTQSSQSGRPDMVMFPEYMVQQVADSRSVVPVAACFEESGFDTSPFLTKAMRTFETEGVQWSMPFNVSNPVLYYLRPVFEAAGLDPADPPVSLEDVRATSQAIVDSGAAGYGIAIDSGVDSGGGWFMEQWFARMGEPYADNGNGRLAPATQVLYAGPVGVEVMTEVQALVNDGLAVTVGDNPSGQDTFLKLADQASPAAMTIGTSAALGTLKAVLDGGLVPGKTSADLGVGPMPGPGDEPYVVPGGASLYIVAEKGDEKAAAAWDFIQFATSAQSQSTWADATGYVPIREDALELEPLRTTYEADPRFKVPYEQMVGGGDDLYGLAPALGPVLEVRSVTAGAVAAIIGGADPATSLAAAASQANALLTDYNARN